MYIYIMLKSIEEPLERLLTKKEGENVQSKNFVIVV